MKNSAIYMFMLIAGSLGAAPHATYTPELRKAFGLIVEMRFDEANTLIGSQRQKDFHNRVPDYLEAAMTCMELFMNEDSRAFDQKQEKIDAAIGRIEKLPDTEPFRNLFLGEIYTAQAILNGKFKNNFTAAWQFYKAYGFLTGNYRKYPEFKPTYIPLGVIYAAIGSLPDEYRSMASLMGFEGSVEQGMLLLQKAYNHISVDEELNFYRPYAGFVFSYVDHQLGAEPTHSPVKLGLNVASSSFLIYLQALYEVQAGNPRAADQWLTRRPTGPAYLNFNYLNYMHGKVLLGLDARRAKGQLETYLERTESDVYVKSSYRYLSWYYVLEGRERKAREMREEVAAKGSATTGADQQAMLENQYPLNEVLIKARIYFDAARYDEALELLNNTSPEKCCNVAREKVEYYYRKGRIYESMERSTEEAMAAFENALNVKDAQPSYALGNSALQLALLHHQGGREAQARHWYKKSLKISKYPFYEGVHQKAKAGMSRLRN